MVEGHVNPETAWSQLPRAEWSEAAGRHLLARLGFGVNREGLETFKEAGPEGVLRAVLGSIHAMPAPEALLKMQEDMGDYQEEMSGADELEKQALRQAMRKRNRATYTDYALEWYAFARDPHNSAQEKLVLFFQDVWVVAFNGVRSTAALFDYQESIRRNLGKSYPEMCKALMASAAMVRYLNLNQSRKGSPNENFARELFELFCLGEGHYSERDIKEAARALTGFVVNAADEVRFVPRRHDNSRKTVFGKSGNFGPQEIIDLVFEQPPAARFLPKELIRFYLTEDDLPEELVEPLGEAWKRSGYSLPFLLVTFFSSRVFYEERYRGSLIKSPVQFYLGLLQDLDLDVFPSPRRTENQVRAMGQAFFNPPNVRGWVGGRHWINSATLMARGQLVQSVFWQPPKDRLNADERRAVEKAEAAGKARFTVRNTWLHELARMSSKEAAEALSRRLHVQPEPGKLQPLLETAAAAETGRARGLALLETALTCPAYHLC